MESFIHSLPHVNATLNSLAGVLLVIGYVLIRGRREEAHKRVMLAAFGVSILFLICYSIYHVGLHSLTGSGSRRFPSEPHLAVRVIYYVTLISHVVLAAVVPFLAIATIYLGLRNRRARHRRLARWTFPIWLYVSITGVVVYVMLYHLYG